MTPDMNQPRRHEDAKPRNKAGRIESFPRNLFLFVVVLLSFFSPVVYGQAWHADGWARRAVVTVTELGAAGVDVAAIRIDHAGQAASDAADYRIFDEAGKPVPYEVTFHDPKRFSLISLRATAAGQKFFIYYAKPGTSRDPMRTLDSAPASGPPQPGPAAGGWVPHAGLVFATLRRQHEIENPMTVPQMLALIRSSPGPDGAQYETNISSSFNPFGDSDYYISVYHGWIHIPVACEYGFCTASNEASFSFIDGKDLVHWPGRHTEKRGARGEYNATVTLAAGPHYVEYLHEEVLLYQTAFLGWKPPGADRFDAVPDALYKQPHRATVARYEAAGGQRTVTINPQLVDNVWPKRSSLGQFTRYHFIANPGIESPDLAGWQVTWDFGDGVSVAAPAADHVYLHTADYTVALHAAGPQGQKVDLTWPLTVYPIEHLGGPYKDGKIGDYAPIVKSYDMAKLASPSLAELVRFLLESNEPGNPAAEQMAAALLNRADVDKGAKADGHLVLAGDAGLRKTAWDNALTQEQASKAADHLRAAADLSDDPSMKVNITARLVRVLGIERSDAEGAAAVYAEVMKLAKPATPKTPRPSRAALRELNIAMGDGYLWAHQSGKAADAYKLAESLAEAPIPPSVRVSKLGAYPEALQQDFTAKQMDDAQELVNQWMDEFPSDQARGSALVWHAKLKQARGDYRASLRPLLLAINVAEGAEFEPEARWLLAQAYRELKDDAGYKAALKALVDSGLKSVYRDQAIAALKR
jgi:hypothetical protein